MTARRPAMAHRPSRVREAIDVVAFLIVGAGIIVALCAVPPEWYR